MKEIDFDLLFTRVIVDEATITALLCLLNEKGVTDDEAKNYVESVFSTLEERDWRELSARAFETIKKKRER